MKSQLVIVTLILAMLVPAIHAQDAPKTDPPEPTPEVQNPTSPEAEAIHNELRAFREGIVEAVVAKDVEKQLQHATKDVVATWQNGETVRGHDGLKSFYEKMAGSGDKVFRGYKMEPTPDDLTIMYGDNAGISFGKTIGIYHLGGKDVELENRWTAALVKEDGQWKIAAYHVSVNALDNPLLDYVKDSAFKAGGIGVAIGILVGIVLSLVVCKSRKKPSAG